MNYRIKHCTNICRLGEGEEHWGGSMLHKLYNEKTFVGRLVSQTTVEWQLELDHIKLNM